MSSDDAGIRAVPGTGEAGPDAVEVVRDLPHPPEKVWRALTQPHLLAEWLAGADFVAAPGHRFTITIHPRPGMSFTFDCEVLAAEPGRLLSYAWNSAGVPGGGLRSVVTWELTAVPGGTRLRMQQTGFTPDQPLFHQGARMGWPRFLQGLDQLLARLA